MVQFPLQATLPQQRLALVGSQLPLVHGNGLPWIVVSPVDPATAAAKPRSTRRCARPRASRFRDFSRFEGRTRGAGSL